MNSQSKILIAGATGLIGSALVRRLHQLGYRNLLTPSRSQLNLFNQQEVESYFRNHRPEYVFIAAGKSGGVYASDTYRAQFLYENLQISMHLIHYSYLYEVKRLLNIGSAHMYPKLCPQPIKEEFILTGPLESTTEPFAIAKIAATKMCETYNSQYGTDFLTAIPSNLYGIHQDDDPLNGAVIPSLLRKFHEAKVNSIDSVTIWGSGRPSRDFIFVDDFSDAMIFLMNHATDNRPINVGSDQDYTVLEVAQTIAKVVGYQGKITKDSSKPEGVLVKLQDTSELTNLGWKAKTTLENGISKMYSALVQPNLGQSTIQCDSLEIGI